MIVCIVSVNTRRLINQAGYRRTRFFLTERGRLPAGRQVGVTDLPSQCICSGLSNNIYFYFTGVGELLFNLFGNILGNLDRF